MNITLKEKNEYSSYIENNEMFIKICLGSTKNDKKPAGEQIAKEHYKMKEQVISLSEFCKALGEGRAFFAANFSEDEDGKVRYRKANFKKSSLIVMDIDNGDFSIDEILDFLKLNNISPNIIYKSFSYTEDCPRFRVIWVVGEVENGELMSDLSSLTYELIKKWNITNKTSKNKKVPHVVKDKKLNLEYDNVITEDDKSGSNIAQMWQGTNKDVYLIHQDYVNIADFVNVFYTLTTKGHSNRITEILKNKCNIGVMGWIGNRKYTEMSSNYYEPRGKIRQIKISGDDARIESVDVWGFKDNLKKDIRKPKVELLDEQYSNGESETLYGRCRLMRELKNPAPHWIDDGGYKTKFKICTNLKFIKDGQDIMYNTICQHSDRKESAWDYTFERINTAFPPVPCSEFCPYASQCKYGRTSIAFAAQKSAYNSEKVKTEHKIEEITLKEAEEKTAEAIRETMNLYEDYKDIFYGWTYGVRKKYHHIGLLEYREENENIKKNIKSLFIEINEIFRAYDIKKPILIKSFIDEYEEIIKSINNFTEVPVNIKKSIITKVESIAIRIKDNQKAKEDIDQKKFDLKDKMDVISVPVGGGKTRALINEIANNFEKLCKTEVLSVPHIAYAAPSHMLAEEFENDLWKEIKNRRIDSKFYQKFNIVRLTPRPVLPFARDEAEIENLEKLGISTSKKIHEFIEIYKGLVKESKIDKDKKEELGTFIIDALLYIENRQQAKKANILITTHSYIQKSFFKAFENIDLVYFDEDICKTTTDNFTMSLAQLIKIKDNLKNMTYGDGFEFTDLIDICNYLLNAPNNKVITFNSGDYACSQVKAKDGKISVVDYITEEKAIALGTYKKNDKIDYLKLLDIKSFIRYGDKFVIGSYNKIDIGSKPLVMLSANPSSIEVLEKITGRNNIKVHNVGFIKQKGEIEQYVNIGACRGDLENKKYIEGIKKILKRDNPDCEEIITYKSNKEDFKEYNTTLHMGATSGVNKISGKNMAVIGTYHIPPIIVNLFAAMFDEEGTIRDIELPKYRKVEYMGIEQKISTYNRGILRDYHLWYIYDEMIQAVGRARAVRQSVKVSIFCQLQNPQAKVHNDEIKKEFVRKTDKEEKMLKSIDKIQADELINIEELPIEY